MTTATATPQAITQAAPAPVIAHPTRERIGTDYTAGPVRFHVANGRVHVTDGRDTGDAFHGAPYIDLGATHIGVLSREAGIVALCGEAEHGPSEDDAKVFSAAHEMLATLEAVYSLLTDPEASEGDANRVTSRVAAAMQRAYSGRPA